MAMLLRQNALAAIWRGAPTLLALDGELGSARELSHASASTSDSCGASWTPGPARGGAPRGGGGSGGASCGAAKPWFRRRAHWLQQARGYMPAAAGPDGTKMESRLIFESSWRRFEEKWGSDFRVPREIVWLLGAPGAGKGVNTGHILKTRGLTKSFHVSGLLESYPESRRLIDSGEMVPDSLVCDLLLGALLLDSPGVQDDLGFVVDGFPRTAVQVDFVKLFFDKLQDLNHAHDRGPLAINFPRPSFKVVVLYVDEETSIRRQLQRARIANMHNRRVLDAGAGHFHEERSTDLDVEKCRKRYGIFKTHYSATLRLKRFFPFTLIDAMGSLAETQEQITKELRYQSSLDLGATTYALIRHLPLARDVVFSARQELVMRLDGYTETVPELFQQVVDRIANDVLPVVRQAGLAGHAEYVTKSSFFCQNPVTVDMLVDVLTDRGFHVCYIREELPLPSRVDPVTGAIACSREPVHRFRIAFETKGVRDDVAALEKAFEIAARLAESGAGGMQRDVRISHSVLPEDLLSPSGGRGGGGGARDYSADEEEGEEEGEGHDEESGGGGGGGGDGGYGPRGGATGGFWAS
ncbi:adenylate kinase [Raphidocelis subcapitata]|uniref:adenylate kinase n=1 Tax=Raphidocelis subcapitata TaxID=307507 RepID=A0A2V0P9L1_9CHLO|nr:adenylate kinase [Raphidocelis subcapitata]|eukprot:GBF96259.1 adenylate kinase [Raphidocelis subcapitata]